MPGLRHETGPDMMRPDQSIVVNLSGRGDKDIYTVAALEGIQL
jgi:tryptophan synthase beta chain